ncbi:MAG: carbohydrate porin [Planctomycetes bacterium]|nr:carbohydrate porin [Planctomycetota bacterium]
MASTAFTEEAPGREGRSGYDGGQGVKFGGPDAVENQIADDAELKGAVIEKRPVQSWFDWKKKIQGENGISLGIDYSAVYLNASEKGLTGEDTASGGMVRFFGSWDLVGRGTKNTGAFVWKIEHRHKYTDIVPKDLGFELGYVGLFEPPFSDQGGRVTNLYWRQRLNEGKATLVGGFLDVTDYVDVFALGSPWTGFMNFAFTVGSASIFTPNDATLGLAGATMISDSLYVIGGLTNAYSDPTEPFEGFDTFVSDNEYFTSLELGWTPSQERIYFDNAHITVWHVDESTAAGTPGGWGVAFSHVRYLKKRFMPFIRGGYADDGGSLLQKSVSAGLGYQPFGRRDLLGIAFNWGEPNEDSFGSGLDDQFTTEVFYRFQLAEQLAITPDLQLLINPALNPNEDQIWVFGLRARLAL